MTTNKITRYIFENILTITSSDYLIFVESFETVGIRNFTVCIPKFDSYSIQQTIEGGEF